VTALRGTLLTLSAITWDATARPVRSPGGKGMRNNGASTQSDVIGQIVMLAWVALKAFDCTTTAGRGLLV
jgi:hypothetical protein